MNDKLNHGNRIKVGTCVPTFMRLIMTPASRASVVINLFHYIGIIDVSSTRILKLIPSQFFLDKVGINNLMLLYNNQLIVF